MKIPKKIQSVYVFIFALVALVLLTVIFSSKTKNLLENNVERELLSDIQVQSVSFETNLKMILDGLNSYARTWNSSVLTTEQLLEFNTTYDIKKISDNFGILKLDGTAILGNDVNIAEYPALKGATQGYEEIKYIENFNKIDKGIMFAVPIFKGSNIHYILYVVKTMEQMAKLNISDESEDYICFVTDKNGDVIIPSKTTGLYIESVVKIRDSESNDENKNKSFEDIQLQLYYYNRGIVEIMLDNQEYFLTIAGVSSTDFYAVSYVNKDTKSAYIDAILRLFLVVVGTLCILFVIIILYISISEKDNKAKVFELAYKDKLTGLFKNEWLLEYIINKDIASNRIMVSLFNIKDFKAINELYGREQGDIMLKNIAQSLRELEWAELVVRCDNDNFAIINERMELSVFEEKMHKFFKNIKCSDSIQSRTTYYRCGVVYPSLHITKLDINKILDDCRQVARLAKDSNKSEIFCFDDVMRIENERIQQIKKDLDGALNNNEFEVFFQPKYEIKNDTIVGAEALIRWNYKKEGYIPPSMFIPCFEEDGSIRKIDRFVFETVCHKLNLWQSEGKKLLPISVNMSRVQLDNGNIVKEMRIIADANNIDPKYIEIELTESANFENIEILKNKMIEIKEAGFGLALDDFGTGYSSFSMLKNMPLDVLKIDKSFIDAMIDDKGRRIVCEIINIAKHLNIKSLAEGVEHQAERDLLKEYGCDYIQGYFYSKPMNIEDYINMLK